jgi:pimeloyl-ACP methyl ester carboxylesterase
MQLSSIARWLKRADSHERAGQLLVVNTEGRGRDVVFVHGLAASPETWEGAKVRLGPDVKLHLVHMKGFAGLAPSDAREPGNFLKPMADDLADYIRSLGRGPVPVVGHSMGGLVTLILGRDHPDVVSRLMVVDVPAFFSVLITPFATSGSMGPLAEHSRRRYVDKSEDSLEDELRRANEKLVGDPDMVERVLRWAVESDRETIADVMAEVMVTDLRGDLARIEAPVDIIYAWDKSGHSTKSGLERTYASAYAGLARGQQSRIDNARHYVMFDQPDIFYGQVRDWLARKD